MNPMAEAEFNRLNETSPSGRSSKPQRTVLTTCTTSKIAR